MIGPKRQEEIRLRTLEEAKIIIDSKCSIRQLAKKIGTPKSTVHKDVSERLWDFSPQLARQVEEILLINKEESTYRGGEATRIKFSKIKK